MRLGVHGLLTDESLHIQPQLIVMDQWQRLLEHLDEELLARGQQQVQDVEDVSGKRLVGHVMKRQLCPVERDIARLEHQALVVERCVVRTRCLVVDGEHPDPLAFSPRSKSSRWTSRVASIVTRPEYAKPPVLGSAWSIPQGTAAWRRRSYWPGSGFASIERCSPGVSGHTSGTPSLLRYQLLQPVVHTVSGIAARSFALKRSVAEGVGSTVSNSRLRQPSIHRRMWLACDSATVVSARFPTGLCGPSIMKKFGKPDSATVW